MPAAVGALVLAGCGTSVRDQVQAKVNQFIKATAHKEYATLCDQVLAPNLVARLASAGIKCQKALSISLGGVQDPKLAIGSITIHGKTASVTVLTTATGQEGSLRAIELTDTSGGWRINGLGTPQFPKAASTGTT